MLFPDMCLRAHISLHQGLERVKFWTDVDDYLISVYCFLFLSIQRDKGVCVGGGRSSFGLI